MTLWRLVRREIRHRKLSFALAVVAVMAPVGALVGTVTLLKAHDLGTRQIIEAKLARTAMAVRARQVEAAVPIEVRYGNAHGADSRWVCLTGAPTVGGSVPHRDVAVICVGDHQVRERVQVEVAGTRVVGMITGR